MMVWVRVDDLMPEHPKLATAGPLGLALDVAGICYASRHLTDGFITEAAVPGLLHLKGIRFDGQEGRDLLERLVERLVETKRWERDDVRGGWWVHDYLDYNPAAADVQERRRGDRDRKAAMRESKRRIAEAKAAAERVRGESDRTPNGQGTEKAKSPQLVRPDSALSRTRPQKTSPQSSTVTEQAEVGLGAEEEETEIQNEAVLTDRTLKMALRYMADEDVKRREESSEEPIRDHESYRERCLARRRKESLGALRKLAEANPGRTARWLATRALGDERGEVPFGIRDHVPDPVVNPGGKPPPAALTAYAREKLGRKHRLDDKLAEEP